LSSHFEMKDVGEADVILETKIRKTNDNFYLCQSHYIEKVLKKFNCFDAPPMRNPSIHLKKNRSLVPPKLSMLKS